MQHFFSILTLLIAFPVFSQNHFIGIKGGINWTDVQRTNLPVNNGARQGFHSGLTYQYSLTKNHNIGLDFLYFQKGFSNKFIFTDESGNPTGENASFWYNYDYLSFPITWGYEIGDQFSAFANVGIVPAYLINANVITPEIEGIVEGGTNYTTDKVNRFDLGAMLEMGAKYRILPQLLVKASFGIHHGITSVTNVDYFKNSEIRHKGMRFSIGVMYGLKRE